MAPMVVQVEDLLDTHQEAVVVTEPLDKEAMVEISPLKIEVGVAVAQEVLEAMALVVQELVQEMLLAVRQGQVVAVVVIVVQLAQVEQEALAVADKVVVAKATL